MGTMLLRRATQIVNRINREAAFEVEQDDDEYGYRRRKKKTQTLNATATVNIDGDASGRVEELRETLLSNKDRMFRLLQIGTAIRSAMAAKQAQCGVSALVTERVMVVRQQQVLESLLGAVALSTYNEVDFAAQVDATRNRLSRATQAQATVEVTTPLLAASDRDKLHQELIAAKRRLLDIDDRLAELNATNSIEITEESERYLQEQGIA